MPDYQSLPTVFFDIETTGLDIGYHEIIEAAFIHSVKGKFSIKIKPRYIARASPEALSINGYNESAWSDSLYFDNENVIKIFKDYLENAIIIGHNICNFDIPFTIAQFKMCGLKSPSIDFTLIDTKILALAHLVPKGLRSLSLKACCSYFGIKSNGEHRALDDCMRNMEMYDALIKHLKWYDGKPTQEKLF
jgi:DNA polymerase III alpha subunit (gram-positive type)